jgi:hypothetical protein
MLPSAEHGRQFSIRNDEGIKAEGGVDAKLGWILERADIEEYVIRTATDTCERAGVKK